MFPWLNEIKFASQPTKEHFYRWILASTVFNAPQHEAESTGIRLRPYQLEFAEAIMDSVLGVKGHELLGLWARQSGKTEVIADIAYFLTVTLPSVYRVFPWTERGFWVGIFGPKKEQADITYSRIRERFASNFASYLLGIELTAASAQRLVLSNNSKIVCSTASLTSSIEGPTFDLVFVEEAQDVPDLRITKSIMPMLAETNGTLVLVGTSTPERRGYFYKALKRTDYRSKKLFKVPYYEAMKYSKDYAKYVKRYMKKLGEHSDSFRTQFLLDWVGERTYFTSIEELRKCSAQPRSRKYDDADVYAGIDVGKANDSTVVTLLRTNGTKFEILDWLELQGDAYTEQASIVASFLKNYNISKALVESSGAGDPFIDMLHEKGLYYVNPFWPDINKVSTLWKELRELIRERNLIYPKVDTVERYKFEEQLSNLEMKYRGTILICKHPKAKGAHDDYPYSLLLAYHAAKEGELFLDVGAGKRR